MPLSHRRAAPVGVGLPLADGLTPEARLGRTRMRRVVLVTALLSAALSASAAHAGTYPVYACSANGKVYDNKSWTATGAVAGAKSDLSCPMPDDPISVSVPGGAATPNDQAAALTFNAPSGTTIADFRIDRELIYKNPAVSNHHRYYADYALGSTVFAGAGNYLDATRTRLDAQQLWYGYPAHAVTVGPQVVTRASFASLGGYGGGARSLSLGVGCFNRSSPCGIAAAGRVFNGLRGAVVTLDDPSAPTVTVSASGLLTGGPRSGSDPVTLSAADNSGIKAVQLLDVTAGAPVIVGSEVYDSGATLTDAKAGCSYRLVVPCPPLSGETVRASSLQVGQRRLVVRVLDAAGNARDAGPFTVDVATPSDRGPLNGAGATETGRLTAGFTTGRSGRRTVDYGERPTVRGRLLNASGQPIAGARLLVLTRDVTKDRYVTRGAVMTGAHGRYSFKAKSAASRVLQVGWVSHALDARFAAMDRVLLHVRAAGSLSAPRSVALGQRLVLRGRLRGAHPPGAVRVVAEGRTGGFGYRPFKRGHASRSGRFRLTYRFGSAASRGHSFRIHVLIGGRSGWPYDDGVTRSAVVRVR